MKHFLHDAVVSVVLSGFAVTFSSLSATMPAKSLPILVSQQINFKPPDNNAPDNRQGATFAGYSPCQVEPYIIPLMPPSNQGLTLSESPSFFAYVSLTSIPVEFYLQTEDGTEVYTTTFKVEKPGIVEVRIPAVGDNKKSLEINKRYQWSFSIICDREDRSMDNYVSSFVKRIEPGQNLQKDLANPDPMARAIAYANNGIWYDTISTLAQMRRTSPEDRALIAEWQQLLQSQKLDAIATQPLLEPR
ncbi:MAG: DUF928 domain-containing protein [Oscillatoriaceae cyanobacterium Prado104]|jgi:hypothetical protein|nr:DUF928 domain-containing protein [Oscillatoriaceae cyanobacterium Prado104]